MRAAATAATTLAPVAHVALWLLLMSLSPPPPTASLLVLAKDAAEAKAWLRCVPSAKGCDCVRSVVVRPGAEQRRAEARVGGVAGLPGALPGAQPLPLRLPGPRQGARAAHLQRLQPLPPHRQPARVRQHRRPGGVRAHRRAHGEDRQLLRLGPAAAAHVQRAAPHAGVPRHLLLQPGARLQGHLQLHQELRRDGGAAGGRVPVRLRVQQQRGAGGRLRQPQLPGLLPARHRVPLLLPRARAREGAPALQLLRRGRRAPVRGHHRQRLRGVLQLHGARPQVLALLRPAEGAGHRVGPEVLPGDVSLQRPPGRHGLQRLVPLPQRDGRLLRQARQQKRRRGRASSSVATEPFTPMPGPPMVDDESKRHVVCIPTALSAAAGGREDLQDKSLRVLTDKQCS